MTHIFDGKDFALQKEEKLKTEVLLLKSKGFYPHLASIIIGDEPASSLYAGLKKKAGKRIGVEVNIYDMPEKSKKEDVDLLIKSFNEDKNITGIMIQFPIPGTLSKYKNEFIELIDSNKDVDGLKNESKFVHPTSKAALEILNFAKSPPELKDRKISTVCVIGSTGMVGKSLVKELKAKNYDVFECDENTKDLSKKTITADVVISATGVPGLIKPSMVKDGVVIIDIGSPLGDVNKNVAEKSSFFTPVPGGVGPVTIVSLMENLIFEKKNL